MSTPFDALPDRLYQARRGLCPFCGAPLKLAEQGRQVECTFCGGTSRVERRLRQVEADLADEPLEAGEADLPDDARWLAEALGDRQAEAVRCPGCGSFFHGETEQAILRCESCATESKLERRLVRVGGQPRRPPQRRSRADLDAQRRSEAAPTWDAETEQLCWRVLSEPDPERQLALATRFEGWSYANATLVYFLPWLLELLLRSERLLAARLADPVGKLLCQDDRRLFAPTLEACAPFVFRPARSGELVKALGLGDGLGVKLLLEAAEHAFRQGRRADGVRALFAAGWVFERNRGQRAVLREILLYRLLYLHGPALGWALEQAHYSRPLALHEDPLAVLRFLDDCAFERPALVAPLQQGCFYLGTAAHAGEFRARLEWLDLVETPAARTAVLMHLHDAPADAPRDLVAGAVARIRRMQDDPELTAAAALALGRLTPDPAAGWQAEPAPALAPEIARARDLWREAARVTWDDDTDAARQNELREAWEGARRLDVPLFLD